MRQLQENKQMKGKTEWRARDIAVIGMMTATLEAAKTALAVLPNIELVSFLLIVYTVVFGKKTFAAAFAFTGVECLVWGMGLWVINYLYIWPVLVAVVLVCVRKVSINALSCAVISGGFGLGFGALCAIPYLFIGGPAMMVSWWIAGIPYDLLHGIGNFLLCLILFRPVYSVLKKAAYSYLVH